MRALDSIKNRPSDKLLDKYGGITLWEMTVRQAMRSTFRKHRTGAVIRNNGSNYSGCSHKSDEKIRSSVHAEQHAMIHIGPKTGGYCYVVTLTEHNNFATCSRPCYVCALSLQKRMIGVRYAEKTNDGDWAIREVPFDFLLQGYDR